MSIDVFPGLVNQLSQLNQQVDNDKLPHARLMSGTLGGGILPLAMAHASYILTGSVNDEKIFSLNHPDLHFTFPVILKNSKGNSDTYMNVWQEHFKEHNFFNINSWTGKLAGDSNKSVIIANDEVSRIIHKLNLKSFLGKGKVLIIWGAEYLNLTAANKLLKIIEEPPANTYLILVSGNTEDFLPTILSRCQITRVKSPAPEEIASFLVDNYKLEKDKAFNISAMAEGDISKAISLAMDHADGKVFHDLFVTWMRLCYKKDLPGVIDWSERIQKLKRDRQQRFLEYCLNFFRQCMIDRYIGKEKALLLGEERSFAEKFGKFVHGANVVDLTNRLNETHYYLERNGNAKVLFFDLSVQIIRLLHIKALQIV